MTKMLKMLFKKKFMHYKNFKREVVQAIVEKMKKAQDKYDMCFEEACHFAVHKRKLSRW